MIGLTQFIANSPDQKNSIIHTSIIIYGINNNEKKSIVFLHLSSRPKSNAKTMKFTIYLYKLMYH